MDWFKIGKGIRQGCILSPCLFNFYAEYIMQNAGLDEAKAGIKTAGRNINNLRYIDETTLMAESEEELKSFLLLSHFSRVQLCVVPQTAATRLPRPWDSPGKNTGVGCHFLLQ